MAIQPKILSSTAMSGTAAGAPAGIAQPVANPGAPGGVAKQSAAQHTPAHTATTRQPEHDATHDADAPRMRRRRGQSQHEDPFALPLDQIPEGSSYEWKRWSVHGQQDPFYISSMRDQGWEPVNPARHPNWVPPGYKEPHLIKGGMILMERPIELTNEAKSEMNRSARDQVVTAEQRLGLAPKDTMTRDHEGVRPRITKEIARMVIEE